MGPTRRQQAQRQARKRSRGGRPQFRITVRCRGSELGELISSCHSSPCMTTDPRRQRDIFPLPLVDEGSGGAPKRRRNAGLRRQLHGINNTVRALNWLVGHRALGDGQIVDPEGQPSVLAHVADLVGQRKPDDAPAPEAALQQLLHGRGVYECCPSGITIAPFQQDLVDLPETVVNSPSLEELLPAWALRYLEGDFERMLAPEVDGEAPRFHQDRRLVCKRYTKSVKDLRRRGLVRFTRRARGSVGLFSSQKRTAGSERSLMRAGRTPNLRALPASPSAPLRGSPGSR